MMRSVRSPVAIGQSRRATLLGFAGLALTSAGPPTDTILKRRSSTAAERQYLRWLNDRRGNAAGLAVLGEAYFALRPDERDAIWLKQALLCDSQSKDCCSTVARSAAIDRTAGDVVVLEGWILARSEARLVSLAYLLTTR
jgi:hypothetical protein